MGLTNVRGKQMHEIVSDKTKCRAEDKTGSCGPESLVRGQVWGIRVESVGQLLGQSWNLWLVGGEDAG